MIILCNMVIFNITLFWICCQIFNTKVFSTSVFLTGRRGVTINQERSPSPEMVLRVTDLDIGEFHKLSETSIFRENVENHANTNFRDEKYCDRAWQNPRPLRSCESLWIFVRNFFVNGCLITNFTKIWSYTVLLVAPPGPSVIIDLKNRILKHNVVVCTCIPNAVYL